MIQPRPNKLQPRYVARDARLDNYQQYRPSSTTGVFGTIVSGLILTAILTLVPWHQFSSFGFTDLDNYLVRLAYIQRTFDGYWFHFDSIVDIFSSEIVWLALLQASVALNMPPETFLFLVSVFSIAIIGTFSARFVGPVLAIVLLVNPAMIDLVNSQVRSAMAISIFLASLMMTDNRKLHYLSLIVAATIHMSMVLILILYWSSFRLIGLKASANVKNAMLVVLIILIVGGFAVLGQNILDYVGDRRSLSDTGGKSLLFMVPWIGVFLLLIFGARDVAQHRWEYYFSLMLLGTVIAIELTTSSLFRLLAACLPIILMNYSLLRPTPAILLVIGMIINNIVFFVLWL